MSMREERTLIKDRINIQYRDMLTTYLDYLCAEVSLERDDVEAIAVSGSNDEAVAEVSAKEYVQKQFQNVSDDELIQAARSLAIDYSINARDEAIRVIVWITAWNISEDEECEDE